MLLLFRHLTKLELSLFSGGFAVATVGLLFYILYVTRYAHWIWQTGLYLGMVFLFGAFCLIFMPFYSRYAALTGITGVFIMILGVAIVRRSEARKKGLTPGDGRKAIIWASLLVIGILLVSIPFFALISNQEVIKSGTLKSSNILYALYSEIQGLRADLERDHQDRIEQVHRDSLVRGLIIQEIRGTRAEVERGLRNDKDVKSALRKRDRPKPVKPSFAPMKSKQPKLGYGEEGAEPLPDAMPSTSGYFVRRNERE